MATTSSSSILKYFFFLCLLFLFLVISPSLSASDRFPDSGYIRIPVKVDGATHQYYTSIGIGTPRHNLNFLIDLGRKILWYDCNNRYDSSSYRPVPCDSPKCASRKCNNCTGIVPPMPGCTLNTCGGEVENPFSDVLSFTSDLGEDLLFLPPVKVPHVFISGCANSDSNTDLLVGLANGIKGILALARTPLSLPNQISSIYNVIPLFTLCLPSSSSSSWGIFIGGRPSFSISVSRTGFFGSSSKEYFLNINSININDKPIEFTTSILSSGTKVSTITPYTMLHSSIYKPFVREFVKAASDRKIKRVKPELPFGACFDANTIGDMNGVPNVPAINLVVDGPFGKGNFDFVGHNAVVEVRKGVVCLAFIDGGKNVTTAIVIGGRQLEERILEFDLSTSTLGFSSSLLLQNASCSNPPLSLTSYHQYM